MKTFLLNISSPDGQVFSGQVVSLIVRGVEGEFAVLAEHAAFITNVVPGKCIVELEDGTVKNGTTEGGLITVGQNDVTYLTAGVTFE
ncbi:MAG: F0F1 ATP synthase subunit epsilon [Clostridiales bacterium]|nr:F0F1 ATP synthase subunit epsilon [Clostridiales bacterium]